MFFLLGVLGVLGALGGEVFAEYICGGERVGNIMFFTVTNSGKNFCLLLAVVWPVCGRAERVVSLNLCTDQVLVELAPEQVVGLEPMARDGALSFVAGEARGFATVRADAEAVLALHPTLILAGAYGAQGTIALLRGRGIRVVQMADARDFGEVAAQVGEMGRALHEEARGRALVAAMWGRLGAVKKRGGTAILYEAGGWTAGAGGFGDAVLRAAGLRNVGTGGRMGVEAVLAARPGVLVTERLPAYPSMATDLAWNPALRGIARATVAPALLACPGVFSVGAVEALTH